MGGINHQTCDGLWHCFTHISQVNIPFIHQLSNSTSWCPSWSKTLMWVKHIGLLVYQPFLYKSPFWMEREIFGPNGGFSGKNHRKKHRIFQPATFDTGGYNPLMGYIYIYIYSIPTLITCYIWFWSYADAEQGPVGSSHAGWVGTGRAGRSQNAALDPCGTGEMVISKASPNGWFNGIYPLVN